MRLPIETPRLVLRAFRDADLGEFLAYRNDPDVACLQGWDGISRVDAAAFLRANADSALARPGEWRQVAIALAPGDELIGDIGLFLRGGGGSAELGFTLAARHQGLGLAREALAALIDALFLLPGLERLEAVTDARNARAMALLERLGFAIESTSEAVFKGGRCEEHTYVLSRGVRSSPVSGPGEEW